MAADAFPYFAAAAEIFAVLAAASAAPTIFIAVTRVSFVDGVMSIGLALAAVLVLSGIQRSSYTLRRYERSAGQFRDAFAAWNFAFLCVLAIGFVTKTSEDFSRGATATLYFCGLSALLGARYGVVVAVQAARARKFIPLSRAVIVGFEAEAARLLADTDFGAEGFDVASTIVLREDEVFRTDDLALAAAAVRMLRPDVVCIAVPWVNSATVAACAETFMRTPAQIHLVGGGLLDRYAAARVEHVGGMPSLSLSRPPLTRLEQLEKRAFDVCASAVGLLILAPLFALCALAIKLESAGPVFFLQRRYGFNQEPFRIFKFRTMRTMEDGRRVKAATRGDPRVTRLGAVMRRLSIDELPQLLNVLRGDMSLVGPRPHALIHDQLYALRINDYARRHNVKPGITGWAQVHGHRGEIDGDAALRDRLEHDLYYIDNWSLWLDVKIVLRTVFSGGARVNAY